MDSPAYTASPVYDRNPSPPPEILEHSELLSEERIGDTVFSKHWLFTTLMKLIEEVDKENENEERDLIVDVDEELQNELCKLWDMSMNSEVAKFLNEFKAVEILTGIFSKSTAPRVTEICVGILGNMACEPNVCKDMAENHKFIDLILVLLESRDVPTLVESTRLIYTSLSNTGTQGSWIKAIQRSEEFLEHVTFIFSSSTNCDLLKNTAELIDRLLDLEPDLCVSWATEDFILSLLEATDQIGSNHSDALELYLNIFQSFSTTESGVEALVVHSDRLGKKIMKYLNIICEYEIVGLGGKEGPLSSALSVLDILMNTQPHDFIFGLCRDEQLIRILLKILEPLYPILNREKLNELDRKLKADSDTLPTGISETGISETEKLTNDTEIKENAADIPDTLLDESEIQHKSADNSEAVSENQQDRSEEGKELDKHVDTHERPDDADMQALKFLHDVLSHFLQQYCKIVLEETKSKDSIGEDSNEDTVKEEGKENMCEADLSVDIANDIPSGKGDNLQNVCSTILTYLDDACSRSRINYLGLTLKETATGTDLFDRLNKLAQENDKERLVRILNDVDIFRIVNRAESRKVDDGDN